MIQHVEVRARERERQIEAALVCFFSSLFYFFELKRQMALLSAENIDASAEAV
jgi:hypothetical protein